MSITLYKNDLPANLDLGNVIAVDTETLGLNPLRDRLCLVQISSGDGNAHLVQFDGTNYDAPNLKKLLSNPKVKKIFHFARFDIAALYQYLDVIATPLFCTKIASKLTRTYTDRHGLRDVVREFTGIELDKQQQSSDWAAPQLSEQQQIYAANDVLYLHQVWQGMEERLLREKRLDYARACFEFVPTRAMLDLNGWAEADIFQH
ncbi:MAG: ribonuclease D [Pseudobdellovibrionaceae bacterium]